MISTMAMVPSSSASLYATSNSVVVRVDKATSEFLIAPDWSMNMDICDIINSNHWVAKDVLRALKKRLLYKNPKVQILSLTLLETMVKNCVDVVHTQIAERNILSEMVKIVKKTMDSHVKDKILVMLDSWQDAFGGPGGKYPQYYWAYQELRNAGLGFPPRSYNTAPIFTPPVSHLAQSQPQLEYGVPSNSSTRSDGTAEIESLSVLTISSMRSIVDLLAEMLQAVNPRDPAAVKDEVIVDLVDRCRANQKKLVLMLTATGEESLLAQGLELNDALQSVLAKHDAIASGTVLPDPVTDIKTPSTELSGTDGAGTSNTEADSKSLVPVSTTESRLDEEEEDDFAQLAQRHSKASPAASPIGEGDLLDSTYSNTLVPIDPPEPVKTTKEQDIIELLSITLSSTMTPDALETPETTAENSNQTPDSSSNQANPHTHDPFSGYQNQTFNNNYVAPWAQPQPQPQPQPQMPIFSQPQYQQMPQPNAQFHYQCQPQPQSQFPQYSGYAPTTWATTPGYFSNPNPSYYMYSTPQAPTNSSQNVSYFPATGNNSSSGIGAVSPTGSSSASAGQKPYIPTYRLFEDLDVFGRGDQNVKAASNTSPSMYEQRAKMN